MAASATEHDGNVTGSVARSAGAVGGDEFCDLSDHPRGLVSRILLVPAMHHRDIGIAAVWDERSRIETILLEKAIRASQNRTERAVVLPKIQASAAKLPFLLEKGRKRPAERIDGLIRIAHHRQPRVGSMMLHELRDELDLCGVNVLILVDDDVLELRR